jgi:hypothetical protein
MDDHDHVISIATMIITWQDAAQQLPLPELRAMVIDCQETLAISLDTFNDICSEHGEHDECTDAVKEAIVDVARQAIATAIFVLGLSCRAHQAAHQN